MNSQKELKLTYALDSSDKMVFVGNVERGLSCNCRCPKCNEPLVAKLGHEGGRQAHFAHRKGSDCHGSYMTALHKLAEQIIEEEKAVMAPEYKEVAKHRLSFTQVEVEQRVERKDLQPDVVGITEDGLRWIIEIRNTHEVDEAKKDKLIESSITCLEIDVRDQTLENLKSFILESAENREWINNPNYEVQIVESKRKRVSKVVKYLLFCTELTIPAYEDYDGKKISIKETFVFSKTDDELFSQVKVLSSDGTPFIFTIGSQDILETNIHRKHGDDCNELLIVTDRLSLEDDICSSTLDMSWSYHLVTEKEREERVQKYRNNPNYEVKLSSDCISECKYKPFYDKCIYKKDTVTLNGVSYVVCNKDKRLKDENECQPHYRYRDDSFVSVKSSHGINSTYRKDNFGRAPYVRQQIIKQGIENPHVQSHVTSTNENLPFDRFWTIEEFCTTISSGFYEDENGNRAEIIKYEKTADGVLILYKDSNEIRTCWPYHIVIISINRGEKNRRIIADFINNSKALDSFLKRIKAMRESACLKPLTGGDEDDLPF
jgi:hypothetical protein